MNEQFNKTFKDSYGDTLTITVYEYLSDRVYLTARELGASPDEAELGFLKPVALDVAKALVEATGQKLVPLSDLKSARDVSFNEGMLRLAAIHKRTVTFRYAKDKGNYIEQRTLNPERVEDDGSSVIGHDPDREDVRRYRLDRIKGEVAFA